MVVLLLVLLHERPIFRVGVLLFFRKLMDARSVENWKAKIRVMLKKWVEEYNFKKRNTFILKNFV